MNAAASRGSGMGTGRRRDTPLWLSTETRGPRMPHACQEDQLQSRGWRKTRPSSLPCEPGTDWSHAPAAHLSHHFSSSQCRACQWLPQHLWEKRTYVCALCCLSLLLDGRHVGVVHHVSWADEIRERSACRRDFQAWQQCSDEAAAASTGKLSHDQGAHGQTS